MVFFDPDSAARWFWKPVTQASSDTNVIRQEIAELLHQQPFQPFTIRLTSGDAYKIRDVALAALLKSGIFIAKPNSDQRVIVPFLYIAAVETANGKPRRRPRRGEG